MNNTTVTTVERSGEAQEMIPLRKRSNFGEIWRRLRKNKLNIVCLVFLAILILATIFAPYITKYDYTEVNLAERFQLPSKAHIMGTDDYGRDLFTRLLMGGRISLLMALMCVIIGLAFGLFFGSITGYYGKTVDAVTMRFMDIIMSIPGMMLAICISVSLGTGIWQTAVALSIGTIPMITRQLRSSTMTVNGQEYIEAAKSFGESNAKIIITHIIPNAVAPVIVQTAMLMGGAIMGIAGLSFLGLGVQPPTPEWGNILNTGLNHVYDFSTRWNMIVFPALFIVFAELTFNLLGDGLRDAMDPRMRK